MVFLSTPLFLEGLEPYSIIIKKKCGIKGSAVITMLGVTSENEDFIRKGLQ